MANQGPLSCFAFMAEMTYNPFPLIVDRQAARVCFLLFHSLLLALRSMLYALR